VRPVCNIFYVKDGNIMYLTDASRFLISCVIQHYAPVVGWGGGGGGWRNRCKIFIFFFLYRTEERGGSCLPVAVSTDNISKLCRLIQNSNKKYKAIKELYLG
jgi:hypothetical protein